MQSKLKEVVMMTTGEIDKNKGNDMDFIEYICNLLLFR